MLGYLAGCLSIGHLVLPSRTDHKVAHARAAVYKVAAAVLSYQSPARRSSRRTSSGHPARRSPLAPSRMEISAGHLVPAGNFCQSSRTSRKLLPANSYQPEDYASHLVPAGTVLYRQMPPRTTISYWYEMVEKMSTRIFGYEMSGTRCKTITDYLPFQSMTNLTHSDP